ncbi:MAG: hypothetical protein SH850_21430 [Planctomycetaceae bacterium]|nr:hypothetical protein [Planctomycetaceae bacterium]
MSRDLRNFVLAGVCGAALVIGWQSWPFAREAQAVAKPAGFQYRSVGADFLALGATLTDLGNDGWQVIDVVHTDQLVETGGDGVTHLIARRVEVIVQKPQMK